MAKSQQTFNKKEKETKRLKKRKEKDEKRKERKEKPKSSGDDMIAYVDEYGNLTDTPPDPAKRRKINAESIEIGVPKMGAREDLSPRKGIVDFYNDSKGFGFIKELDTQQKYFFHVNGVLEEVKENDKVSFELEHGLKGMNAVQVKKV
jgi:cold shock CspA family protein